MGTMTLPTVVASPWTGTPVAERFGNAPIAPSQGTGVPFAGMSAAAAAAKPAGYAAAGHVAVTAHLVAVRQDDDRFRPRGPEL